jgi:hypothetical protein
MVMALVFISDFNNSPTQNIKKARMQPEKRTLKISKNNPRNY